MGWGASSSSVVFLSSSCPLPGLFLASSWPLPGLSSSCPFPVLFLSSSWPLPGLLAFSWPPGLFLVLSSSWPPGLFLASSWPVPGRLSSSWPVPGRCLASWPLPGLFLSSLLACSWPPGSSWLPGLFAVLFLASWLLLASCRFPASSWPFPGFFLAFWPLPGFQRLLPPMLTSMFGPKPIPSRATPLDVLLAHGQLRFSMSGVRLGQCLDVCKTKGGIKNRKPPPW